MDMDGRNGITGTGIPNSRFGYFKNMFRAAFDSQGISPAANGVSLYIAPAHAMPDRQDIIPAAGRFVFEAGASTRRAVIGCASASVASRLTAFAMTEGSKVLSQFRETVSESSEVLSRHCETISEGSEILSQYCETVGEGSEALSQFRETISEGSEALSQRCDTPGTINVIPPRLSFRGKRSDEESTQQKSITQIPHFVSE